jgi:uncharacterized membrane protein HdeD (DUF308 family)
MKSKPDRVSLAAGIALLLLGILLILDQTGTLELTVGWLGAAFAAALGSVLVISGLDD